MIAPLGTRSGRKLRSNGCHAGSRDLLVFAGDLGGTHLSLAVFKLEQGQLRLISHPVSAEWAGCGSFAQVLEMALQHLPADCDLEKFPVAVVGAAGTIRHGVAHLSKYPGEKFEVEKAFRRRGFQGEFTLINDFAAQSRSVGTPAARHRVVVVPGRAEKDRQRVVVGAGTGFGIGPVIPIALGGETRWVFPKSEGGNCPALVDHALWSAPKNGNGRHSTSDVLYFLRKKGLDLLQYMRFVEEKRLRPEDKGQLRAEMFVSGRGLVNCYLWVHKEELPAAEVAARILPKNPATLDQIDKLDPSLVLFAYLYGQLVRTAALFYEARGGVWIVGGVAQKSPHLVCNAAFRDSYSMFGVHQLTLGNIPVSLLLSDTTGLWGAACYATEQVL